MVFTKISTSNDDIIFDNIKFKRHQDNKKLASSSKELFLLAPFPAAITKPITNLKKN
jgi:hypothetical protein